MTLYVTVLNFCITVDYLNSVLEAIVDDPMSEERQGRNIAKAAREADVQCFIWSTMPSSLEVSKGQLSTRVYDGNPSSSKFDRNKCLIWCR